MPEAGADPETVDAARKDRDTLGGVVEVRATGVPPGLGSYARKDDRLDARLAAALMGIQAVKGVEIGDGFALAAIRGSEAHDEIVRDERGIHRSSNRAGGIEGGMSNGEEIVVRAAMKPLPTLMQPLASVDLATGEPAQALVERSDVSAVEALAVVAEGAVAWELARLAKDKFGGDALGDFVAAWQRVRRADRLDSALTKHVALIGFMGAGKTTLGDEVARRLNRHAHAMSTRLVETTSKRTIPELFAARRGRLPRARRNASSAACSRIPVRRRRSRRRRRHDAGGAAACCTSMRSPSGSTWTSTRAGSAFAAPTGRSRRTKPSSGGSSTERRPLYAQRPTRSCATPTTSCSPPPACSSSAARCVVSASSCPATASVALVSDPNVAGIHGMDAQLALGPRLAQVHELPPARRRRRSPRSTGSGRGCGSTAAARSSRSAAAARPTPPASPRRPISAACRGFRCRRASSRRSTRRSAARRASTSPQGKNLVGAFHWPARTIIDPALLETLPPAQRLEGLAEVVKTGLLVGEPLWELPDDELVRRCAAFKAAICLRDPHDNGERKMLNLGHTFAHALEAAAGYEGVSHGQAVALGLLAALRLSGRDIGQVEEILRPKPVRVDRERAWEAMQRDKKNVGGELRLVLLGEDGPEWDVAVPADDVRRELDALIA